jgi:hypothetical protein
MTLILYNKTLQIRVKKYNSYGQNNEQMCVVKSNITNEAKT